MQTLNDNSVTCDISTQARKGSCKSPSCAQFSPQNAYGNIGECSSWGPASFKKLLGDLFCIRTPAILVHKHAGNVAIFAVKLLSKSLTLSLLSRFWSSIFLRLNSWLNPWVQHCTRKEMLHAQSSCWTWAPEPHQWEVDQHLWVSRGHNCIHLAYFGNSGLIIVTMRLIVQPDAVSLCLWQHKPILSLWPGGAYQCPWKPNSP